MAVLARAAVPWRTLTAAALASVLLGAAFDLLLSGARPGQPHASQVTAPEARSLSSLPLAAQGPVSATLGAGRAAYRVAGVAGDLRLSNPAQRLDARFRSSGVAISDGVLHVSLRLRAVGYGAALHGVRGATPRGVHNRVSYAHDGIAEWYANGPLGLEQGFTIGHAPAANAHGWLTLAMTLGGNGVAALADGGRSVVVRRGASSLRYTGLIATDATGRRLPSRLALRGGELLIGVSAHDARYPLRVDPLVQQARLTGKEQAGGSNLGQSVAISADGNTALVGGPSDEAPGEMLVGSAWVFTRSGGTWTQQGPKLRGGGRVGEGQFGISVALSADGNTALIGGINDANVGAAWVFTRSGDTWTQQGPKLTGGGEETGSGRFGKSVALSADGNTALIGGYFDAGDVGAAWVFRRSGAAWAQEGKKLTGFGESSLAQFGLSVALSADGKTALIGGPSDEGTTGEPMAGAAWVFTNGGSGWTQQGPKLTSGGAKGAGELGSGVALSADGSTALVGAPADGVAGGVRAYVRSGSTWAQQGAELKPSDATGGAGFGAAVSVSADGNTALVGGPVDADGPVGGSGPTPSGAIWEFARSGSTWAQQGSKLVGTTSESEFGAAVAFSQDARTALIGGPIDSTGGVTDAGALWVYVNPAPAPVSPPATTTTATTPSSKRRAAARAATGPLWSFAVAHTLANRQRQAHDAQAATRDDVLVHAQRRRERQAHIHSAGQRTQGERQVRRAEREEPAQAAVQAHGHVGGVVGERPRGYEQALLPGHSRAHEAQARQLHGHARRDEQRPQLAAEVAVVRDRQIAPGDGSPSGASPKWPSTIGAMSRIAHCAGSGSGSSTP